MRRLLSVALLFGLTGLASAQHTRALRVAESGTWLVASGSFTDVFDAELLDQMASGFIQTVSVRVSVHRQGEDRELGAVRALYRVVYSHWDEVYLVRLRDPSGERDLRFTSRAEALKALTTLHDLPVALLALVPEGKVHYLEVVVDVNPISSELLAEVRRWLSQPRGEKPAGISTFFGSFVSVFVNPRIVDADRTLRFRSQDFYR